MLSALVMVCVSALVVVEPANAAQNPRVVVSNLSFVEVDQAEQPIDDAPLRVGEQVKFSMDFDATQAGVRQWDSFTVILPPQFTSSYQDAPLTLEDSEKVGDCSVFHEYPPTGRPYHEDSPRVLCTFYRLPQSQEVRGSVEFVLQVDDISQLSQGTAKVNGWPRLVPFPYDARILPPVLEPAEVRTWTKEELDADDTAIEWHTSANGEWLKQNLSNGKATIVEHLGAGHVFSTDPATLRLSEICTDLDVRDGSSEVDVAFGDARVVPGGEGFAVAITPAVQGQAGRISMSGPFKDDCNYVVHHTTHTTDGAPVRKGHFYVSAGRFEGSDATFSARVSHTYSNQQWGETRGGRGSFVLTKYTEGAALPEDQEINVVVEYERPEQGADGGDLWLSPPKSPSDFMIQAGEMSRFGDLPAGATVTLSENTAAVQAVPGGSWAAPRFSSSDPRVTILDGGRRASFPVVDQKDIPVALVNTWVPDAQAPLRITARTNPAELVVDHELTYDCSAPGGDGVPATGTVSVRSGAVVTVGSFPVGTTCAVVALKDAVVARYDLLSKDFGPIVQIAQGEENLLIASATYAPRKLVSVGDMVWWDADRDGLQSPGEAPAAGVAVTLKDADGAVVAETLTNDSGHYWFRDLTPGARHELSFQAPEGAAWTTRDVGGDDALDSDVAADGVLTFTAPAAGANGAGAPNLTDDPSLDAGLVRIEPEPAPEPTPSEPTQPTPDPVEPTPVPEPVEPTPSPLPSTPVPSSPEPSPAVPTPSPTLAPPSEVVPAPSTPVPSPMVPTSAAPTPSRVVPAPSPTVAMPSATRAKPSAPSRPPRPGLPKTGR
ncbi:MAG: SdrD B-like domain-containing protein [Propionibacteriaceae bacterium]|nr:SdrD B-like domain-containing protein [Propionibacteriaceae bacterium]